MCVYFRDYKYESLQQEESSDDIQREEIELTSTFLPQYEQVVERPIRSGETLRTIALNYRISVSVCFSCQFN